MDACRPPKKAPAAHRCREAWHGLMGTSSPREEQRCQAARKTHLGRDSALPSLKNPSRALPARGLEERGREKGEHPAVQLPAVMFCEYRAVFVAIDHQQLRGHFGAHCRSPAPLSHLQRELAEALAHVEVSQCPLAALSWTPTTVCVAPGLLSSTLARRLCTAEALVELADGLVLCARVALQRGLAARCARLSYNGHLCCWQLTAGAGHFQLSVRHGRQQPVAISSAVAPNRASTANVLAAALGREHQQLMQASGTGHLPQGKPINSKRDSRSALMMVQSPVTMMYM